MDLQDVREILLTAERSGADVDEPEGSRYIQISETLALQMARGLGRPRLRISRRAALFLQQLGGWLRENG